MFKSMGNGNAQELPKNTHISEGEATMENGPQSADLPNTSFENVLLNDLITEEEVQNAIRSLKNNKAYGSDLIFNEFFVHSSSKMSHNFVTLFNIILDTGIIPSDWWIGLIKPLFKNKGSPQDPSNFWAITILSCFGKLFTSILNKRITDFIESFQILGCEQAGFRRNHSTTDHLFTLYGIIDILLAKKKRLYCAFLDYEKAFDKVDRIFYGRNYLNKI